jgi:hypothetical protein
LFALVVPREWKHKTALSKKIKKGKPLCTSRRVKPFTKIKPVHVLKVHWPVRVLGKERLLKRSIFIVDVNCFSEDVRGVDLCIQVYKGATAADETVTEQEMDSLLCGDISVGRHSREQLLDCTLSG